MTDVIDLTYQIIPEEDCKVSEMVEGFDNTMDCNHADLARFPSTADPRFRKFISTLNQAIVKTMASEDLPIFSAPIEPPPEPADFNKPPPSPPPTPPVEVKVPKERPPPPKALFDPRDGPDERIIYWKRRTREEETHKQRMGFLHSLKGWTEYNTGSHLSVAPGTCSWTLEDRTITFWRTDPDCGTMFITGEAGRGKTHLAKDMANRLRVSHSTETIMSFHCTPGERPAIWEYFTWYLISQDPAWFDEVPAQYRNRDADSPPLSTTAFSEIWNAFRTKPSLRTIYMIVDGLEQCGGDSFEEFFKSVQQLRAPVVMAPRSQDHAREEKRGPARMKVAFTCRPTPTVELARSRLTYTSIRAEIVNEDVATYLNWRFGPLVHEKGGELDERTFNFLKTDIVGNANGYWPYAKFAIEEAEQAVFQGKDFRIDLRDHIPVGLRTCLRQKILAKLKEPGLDHLARTVVTYMVCSPFQTFFNVSVLKDMIRVFLPDDREDYDIVAGLKKDWGEFLSVTSKGIPTASFLHESIAHVMRSMLPEKQRLLNNAFVSINYLLLEDFIEPLYLARSNNFEPRTSMERFLLNNPFYGTAAVSLLRDIRASGVLALQLIPFLRAFFDRDCPQYKTWCAWADWSLLKPRGVMYASPIVLHLVSSGCVNVLEHFIPPPSLPSGQLPKRKSCSIREQDIEDSFLEAENWPETSRDDGQTALLVAINSGRPDVIDFVLQYDPDVNHRSKCGLTPLLACFSKYNLDRFSVHRHVIELLLRRGADVDAFETRTGLPALCHAAQLGDVEIVKLLLSYGANVHVSGTTGRSALEKAFAPEDVAAFALIVDCGADVDTWWSTGEVPLSVCIVEDSMEMFNILLPICDVNGRDADGLTPLNIACNNPDRNEYIRQLLQHPSIDIDALEQTPEVKAGASALSPLVRAVREDNYQAVEMLLHAGADPGTLPGTNASPLFLAVVRQHADIVRLLLSFNSPVNHYSPRSWPCTALGFAVKREDEKMVALLLENGADPTIEDAYGRTGPLAIAAASKDEPNMGIIQMLLSALVPANVNCLYDRCPIITEASEIGNVGLVRLLLEKGVDLTAWLEPHMMPSPLVMAAEAGHVEVCEVLLEREPRLLDIHFKELKNCDTPLIAGAEAGKADVVRFLLGKGARPDIVSPVFNKSPLLVACKGGHFECVEILLEAAPEMVNVPNAMGCMPWMMACDQGNLKIMRALLDAGADFTRMDRYGNSYIRPNYFAEAERPEKTIDLLLEYGFDVNAPHNDEGETVFCFAILDGTARHVKWLLEHGADPLRCEKSLWKEDTWSNALISAMSSSDPQVLELLLEPKWGLLEHLKDVDDVGVTVLGYGTRHARMFEAIEAYGSETGEDLLHILLSQRNIYGRTAADIALGDVTIRSSSRPGVIAMVLEKINKVLNLTAYNHNEHQELLSGIGYDLLELRGNDEVATSILTFVIASPELRHQNDESDQRFTAWRSCVVCDGDMTEIALACRFCWRLRCLDCEHETHGSGVHTCEMVEVSLVKQDGFDLKETLRAVVVKLETSEPGVQLEEEQDAEISLDEGRLQSSLQLAVLHAFNFLAIRRPLFTPYLELAPSVQDFISPWEHMISEQRRYWETDNMIFEMHWTRLCHEMRYLNRGLGRAYVDEVDVRRGLILEDMKGIFEIEEENGVESDVGYEGRSVTEFSDSAR